MPRTIRRRTCRRWRSKPKERGEWRDIAFETRLKTHDGRKDFACEEMVFPRRAPGAVECGSGADADGAAESVATRALTRQPNDARLRV